MTTSIRFKRLRILGLFGSHDIDISFRLDERVTVLHGRNGSGKTVTLKLMAALREGRYEELAQYPFKQLVIEWTDGSVLTIDKPDGKNANRHPYNLRRPGSKGDSGHLATPSAHSGEDIERYLRPLGVRRAAIDLWLDTRRGVTLSTDAVIERYRDRLDRLVVKPDEPLHMRELRDELPKIKFIQTDRLFVREGEDIDGDEPPRFGPVRQRLMVEHLSQKIRAIVQEADREYRLISTKLDSTLRQRIFHPPANPSPLGDLVERNKELRKDEARLQTLGLLRESPGAMDEAALTDNERGMFEILLEDLSQKLAPFRVLATKAERLLNSLNDKLAPKQVRLNVETGYQVVTALGDSLPLDRLSSGEQHELVLLHELLFDLEPGTLILIDEPELSLHVKWQEALLPELLEIAQLAQLDFVLATHSPFIVGDGHAALMVRLGEPLP